MQHAQPLSSEMISSATFRFSLTSVVSISTLPNSFSMTHTFCPVLLVRMWLMSVVLPAPRKPVMMVTGVLSASGTSSINSSSSSRTSGSSKSCRTTRSSSAGAKMSFLSSSSTWYGTHMPSGKERCV